MATADKESQTNNFIVKTFRCAHEAFVHRFTVYIFIAVSGLDRNHCLFCVYDRDTCMFAQLVCSHRRGNVVRVWKISVLHRLWFCCCNRAAWSSAGETQCNNSSWQNPSYVTHGSVCVCVLPLRLKPLKHSSNFLHYKLTFSFQRREWKTNFPLHHWALQPLEREFHFYK